MPPRRPTANASAVLLAGVLAAGALSGAACAGSPRAARGAPAPQARTTVTVRNQNFLDMNIYVVRGGVRSRLGTVPGTSTRTFTVPASFVQPLARLRFQADPIGGAGAPVSEEITVSPGDEVTLTLPPR